MIVGTIVARTVAIMVTTVVGIWMRLSLWFPLGALGDRSQMLSGSITGWLGSRTRRGGCPHPWAHARSGGGEIRVGGSTASVVNLLGR